MRRRHGLRRRYYAGGQSALARAMPNSSALRLTSTNAGLTLRRIASRMESASRPMACETRPVTPHWWLGYCPPSLARAPALTLQAVLGSTLGALLNIFRIRGLPMVKTAAPSVQWPKSARLGLEHMRPAQCLHRFKGQQCIGTALFHQRRSHFLRNAHMRDDTTAALRHAVYLAHFDVQILAAARIRPEFCRPTACPVHRRPQSNS